MAEPQEVSSEAGTPVRGRGTPPLLLILLLLCSVASLVVSTLTLLTRPRAEAAASGQGTRPAATHPRERHDLGEFLVNLADPDGNGYVKATLVLEYEGGKPAAKGGHGGAEAAPEWEAPVRDAVVSVLSACQREELRQESGKSALKKRLLARINGVVGKGGPQFVAVYFTSFAMQ